MASIMDDALFENRMINGGVRRGREKVIRTGVELAGRLSETRLVARVGIDLHLDTSDYAHFGVLLRQHF